MQALERPSLAARLSDLAGKPVGLMRQALPPGASKVITVATARALRLALKVALRTLRNGPELAPPRLHKSLAAGTGAIGGSFGLFALPFEFPVSTLIMLRSILDIARDEGEDLRDPEAALACLQVFALGGRANEISENGYLAEPSASVRGRSGLTCVRISASYDVVIRSAQAEDSLLIARKLGTYRLEVVGSPLTLILRRPALENDLSWCFSKASSDARPDRRDTRFGYCVRP